MENQNTSQQTWFTDFGKLIDDSYHTTSNLRFGYENI